MPVAVSYPGVYIEEIPSGVHTITGVATSIAAFVDFFAQGPLDEAVRVLSFADYERKFGGLDQRSEASYGIQQLFLNGGSEAYVVRVSSATSGKGAVPATIALADAPSSGTKILTATAASPGAWGNNVRIEVDYGTTNPDQLFNLAITEVQSTNGKTQVVATETFRNLVLDPTQSNDAVAVVNADSSLVALKAESGSANKRPAQTGTASKVFAASDFSSLSLAGTEKLDVKLGATTLGTTAALSPAPTDFASLAAALQTLIRGVQSGGKSALPNATVSVVGSTSTKIYLVAEPGTDDPADFIVLSDNAGTLANKLGLSAGNVQQYALGSTTGVQGQVAGQKGDDGTWDPASDAGVATGLIGDPNQKTGMYALLDVDLFNILCIPATMSLPDPAAAQVAADAISLCTTRRAMYLLDVPQQAANRDTIDGVMKWLDANATLRSRNAALYFPRPEIADPLNAFRLRPAAPSGTMAGLFARTDAARGVWKAPAGTEASLGGVQQLEYKLTDPENGVLNPLAINCLRVFPVYGSVCWGARTLAGADQLADDYKYIPVRRLALYIEESLFRGTQWVVFEPNAAPLWSQIRLNVGSFMQNLFRQGAFKGTTPQDAYFVQCDDKTNPPDTINLGIVNIVVGFAPLKPAEFVVIQIQQIAEQLAV
jgi:uncharacterized protein